MENVYIEHQLINLQVAALLQELYKERWSTFNDLLIHEIISQHIALCLITPVSALKNCRKLQLLIKWGCLSHNRVLREDRCILLLVQWSSFINESAALMKSGRSVAMLFTVRLWWKSARRTNTKSVSLNRAIRSSASVRRARRRCARPQLMGMTSLPRGCSASKKK